MAEDEGRAARIAELKSRHPRLTWAKIAEHVGVTERAATQWQRTGALKPENAEALADLFGVDFDYVWTGPRPDTPELFVDRRNTPKAPVAVDRLDGELEQRIGQIEKELGELRAGVRAILDMLGETRKEQDAIRERLEADIAQASGERQQITAALGMQTEILGQIQNATRHADAAAGRLDVAAARAGQALRDATPGHPGGDAAPSRSRSRRASSPDPS